MGESLELSHRALNRDGFVRGAIAAAMFLAGKPAGLYTMADVLG
jgi:4-hydroxy-tetrahydrodipicolinate reductase